MQSNNNKAIGIIDSGLGGLTAVKEIEKKLPKENIIYFGDNLRSPYGLLTANTIKKYSLQIVNYLKTYNLKMLIIACGTISVIALEDIKSIVSLPVLGVVEPCCKEAVRVTKNKKIGIIGTATSIKSGVYEKTLKNLMPESQLYSYSCQGFVDLVECGNFHADDWKAQAMVAKYLYELKQADIDTLILGCTHFPVLLDSIRNYMGEKIHFISSGTMVADCAAEYLEQNQLMSNNKCAEEIYYTTGEVERFEQLAGIILGKNVKGSIKSVDKKVLECPSSTIE